LTKEKNVVITKMRRRGSKSGTLFLSKNINTNKRQRTEQTRGFIYTGQTKHTRNRCATKSVTMVTNENQESGEQKETGTEHKVTQNKSQTHKHYTETRLGR